MCSPWLLSQIRLSIIFETKGTCIQKVVHNSIANSKSMPSQIHLALASVLNHQHGWIRDFLMKLYALKKQLRQLQ